MEEFKYLVLFTSEGRMEREIDGRIGAASAVMQALHRPVVVKKELSQKAKLTIYRSIYVPTLTYGHEVWVVTERTRYKRPKWASTAGCLGSPLERGGESQSSGRGSELNRCSSALR